MAVITYQVAPIAMNVITGAYYNQCSDGYLLSYIITTTRRVQLGLGVLFSAG